MTTRDAFDTASAVLLSLGGGGAIVLLFSKWLGKVWAKRIMLDDRAKHDRELEKLRSNFIKENDRLKADLDKTLHVSKFHFEKEYEIYREIWGKLIILRKATLSLRPISDPPLDAGETAEDRKKKRALIFVEAYADFEKVIENNRPFYHPMVWDEVCALKKLTYGEAVSYRFSNENRDWEKYWAKAEENYDKIIKKTDQICESIRTRLADYKVA